MFSNLSLGRVPIEVQINLAQRDSFYTNQSCVSGDIVLDAKCSVNITTIVVTLSGAAISRLGSQGSSEIHQLFQRTQRIFPPEILSEKRPRSDVTVGRGRHIFPFSATFPDTSECYRTTIGGKRKNSIHPAARQRKLKGIHLLRPLPPSVSEAGSNAEIKYFLEVVITGNGIPKGCSKSRREILFCPLVRSIPTRDAYQASQSVGFDREITGPPEPLLWQIDTELLNGHFILSGHPVPLRISITKLYQQSCQVLLQEFQTMLIETTQIQVHGSVRAASHCWMVQTVANLKQELCFHNEPAGTTIEVPKAIWASHPVPLALSPSFETCNIKRSYQLVLRLGFQNGMSRCRVLVREFQFPVHIMATQAPDLHRLSRHRPVDALIASSESNLDKQDHSEESFGLR